MARAPDLSTLAHAKLNLSLRVLVREAGGYHQIETLFCALELADAIDLAHTPSGVSLEVVTPPDEAGPPPDLGPASLNLATRAAALFLETASHRGGFHIRLTKRIPAGAGLGGGSSDAAAVLMALNRMTETRLSDGVLLELGAALGSDVPFFVTGASLALAWGRGGRLAPLPALPAAPVVLAVPPERVSTAAAYASLTLDATGQPAVFHAPTAWADVAAAAGNDFEDVIFPRHPRLAAIRHTLADAGAIVARMTGSGSVLFGIFADVAAADAASLRVTEVHPDVTVIRTQTRAGG